MTGFTITRPADDVLWVDCPNGFRVSLGRGDRHSAKRGESVEVLIWNPAGEQVTLSGWSRGGCDAVIPNATRAEVSAIIKWAAER
jgi:hypothetical protein